jgi:hypothetical protein
MGVMQAMMGSMMREAQFEWLQVFPMKGMAVIFEGVQSVRSLQGLTTGADFTQVKYFHAPERD